MQELRKQLLEMGYRASLVDEAMSMGLSKEAAVEYILNSQEDDWQDIPQPILPKPEPLFTKMVIVVRADLKPTPGKVAALAADAVLATFTASEAKALKCIDTRKALQNWFNESGQKKVVLRSVSGEELSEIARGLEGAGIVSSRAGEAEAMGIGPFWEKVIDGVTGKLRLL